MHISITLPLRSDHGPPCSLLWADTNGSQNILWRQKIMIALIIDFGQNVQALSKVRKHVLKVSYALKIRSKSSFFEISFKIYTPYPC